jgi:hypothetical protein
MSEGVGSVQATPEAVREAVSAVLADPTYQRVA